MTVVGYVEMMECGVSPVNQTALVSALVLLYICYVYVAAAVK